jgi:hypothetical protein
MATVHFSETQKFRQWWMWLILATTLLIPIGIFVNTYFHQEQNSDDGLYALIPGILIVGVVIFLLLSAKLTTELDEYVINYRFYPFHFSNQKIHWEDVQSAFVREYQPILEYGGWGLRYSLGNGKAYNVMGNVGLQLQLKNGKKILLGTQKKSELQDFMKTLYQLKIVNQN